MRRPFLVAGAFLHHVGILSVLADTVLHLPQLPLCYNKERRLAVAQPNPEPSALGPVLFGAGLAAAAHFVLLLLPTMAYMARRALVGFGLPLTALPMNFQTGEGVGLHLLLSFGFITCLAVFVNCIQARPLPPPRPPSLVRRSSRLFGSSSACPGLAGRG